MQQARLNIAQKNDGDNTEGPGLYFESMSRREGGDTLVREDERRGERE
jgi:hypothetical protein